MTGGLWPFALRFYDEPAVQSACIVLQDRHGADVNVLLCLLWLSSLGETLSAAEVARMDRSVQEWRETVVKPLRSIRRELKDKALDLDPEVKEVFRKRVKAIEIESERLELGLLEKICGSAFHQKESNVDAAQRNLEHYQMYLETNFQTDVLKTLLRRFSAA